MENIYEYEKELMSLAYITTTHSFVCELYGCDQAKSDPDNCYCDEHEKDLEQSREDWEVWKNGRA